MIKAKNILLIRTDRIGELVLTLPAFRAARKVFPEAKISAMVDVSCAEVIEGSFFVDSVIKIETERVRKSLAEKFRLFWFITNSKFDLVIIFNPSRIFNIITFFAGIPARVGYNRKAGILLTHKIEDRKHLCNRHEVMNNLGLLRAIGVEADDTNLYFPIAANAENRIEGLLKEKGISVGCRLIAIHPAASNPAKMWPSENFARLCDMLVSGFDAEGGIKIILVGGKDKKAVADEIKAGMRADALDLTGCLSIKELGSFLKRCFLLISNDSGPVHISAAVGTPAVVFFGEARSGGASKRWGPYGEGHLVLGKADVSEITVEEAYAAITEKFLRDSVP